MNYISMFLQDTWQYLKEIINKQQPVGAASNIQPIEIVQVEQIEG